MRKSIASLLTALVLLATPLISLSSSEMTAGQQADTSASLNSTFRDVGTEDPYLTSIQYLKQKSIIQGYQDGNFRPFMSMNRAEFMKVAMGRINKSNDDKNCFTDVKEDWFAPYICRAKKLGYVNGYEDGSFKPAENISLVEAAKILNNIYKLSSSTAGENWYEPYIKGLESKNAIPMSVEFFDAPLKRGELATMIHRLDANITTEASLSYDEIAGEGFVKVTSCEALKKRFEKEYSQYQTGYMYDLDIKSESGVIAPTPAMAPDSISGGSKSLTESSGRSSTNVQVEGVDEGDIIKNDDKFIYLLKGNSIRIIEAYPANTMKELVKFTLEEDKQSFYPQEMYLSGNKLIVVGSESIVYPTDPDIKTFAPMPYYEPKFTVYILDITDKSKPKVERKVAFEGFYQTSRLTNDTLYVVLNRSQGYAYPMMKSAVSEPAIVSSPATEAPVDMKMIMPPYSTPEFSVPTMLDSKVGKEEKVAECGDILIFPKTRYLNYVITAAISIKDTNAPISRSVLIGNADTIYASNDSLYIAASIYSGFWNRNQQTSTTFYKFQLTPSGITYKSTGSVPGNILNQFSMDEHNGFFRVATTEQGDMGNSLSNSLFILDKDMKTVGNIRNIAPTERIYSTRFIGNRAYMVTFRQVDPLFVLDLSAPSAPKILGQLKIPGFSNYLHPYDENHIIGFGKDVEALDENATPRWNTIKGMKIGMFDVSDVSNPKEKFVEIIGDNGTDSELLYNHKALLFDKEKKLMAFPITVLETPKTTQCSQYTYSNCPKTSCQAVCVPSSCTMTNGVRVCSTDCDGPSSCIDQNYGGKVTFQGAYVYSVDAQQGFKLQTKISHYSMKDMEDLAKNGYFTDYEKTINRVLYIADTLYTVSQAAVKANSLTGFAEKAFIMLAGQ